MTPMEEIDRWLIMERIADSVPIALWMRDPPAYEDDALISIQIAHELVQLPGAYEDKEELCGRLFDPGGVPVFSLADIECALQETVDVIDGRHRQRP